MIQIPNTDSGACAGSLSGVSTKLTPRPRSHALWILALLLLLLLIPGTARAVFPPGNTNSSTTLDTWSFNGTTNWTSDLGYAPISFTNLSSSPLGDGPALVLDSTNAAWLQYNVTETSGTNNLAVRQGTVMFWFAPNWTDTNNGGTGPGQFGRLIDAGAYTTNASYGWWSFYLDPAGTNIYFAAQTNGSQALYISAPVKFVTTNRWHMLALTYSATNSAFYFDGILVTNGAPVSIWPGPNVLTNGFYIGSDNTGIDQAHGMFDDVATYNYPLDAGTIGTAFIFSSFYYYANPLNRANFSSAPWYPNTNAGFQAITGSGYLVSLGTDTNCVTSSSVWLTNVVATVTTNRSVNLSFTIAGGSNNVAYDVFATADLQYPLTNAIWAWMGQGSHCNRYMLTNLPLYSAYLILGTPRDTDGDGLTDAFELLVSHTDPNNPDTYGVGMSDGFQWGYFGQGGLDPFSDPFNNGWTLLDEYLNGLDPTVYNQPPAPQGVAASYINSTATVQWNFSSGGVTGYTLQKFDPVANVTTNISILASTNEYVDAGQQVIDDDLDYGPPLYRVQAQYGAHPSAWSGWVPLYKPDPGQFWGSGYFIRGTQGQGYLAVPALPPNASTARIVFANSVLGDDTSWIAPVSSFTNNCYLLPPQLLPQSIFAGNWYVELKDANTNLLGTIDFTYIGFHPLPFYDGRQQLQQNLSFLLRAADASSPFQFTWEDGANNLFYDCASNYASASFVDLVYDDPGFNTPSLDEFSPFRNNYLYRNFSFATGDLNSNGTLDSAGYGANGPYVPQYPVHGFPGPTNGTHIDPVLSATDLPWTFFRSYYTTTSSELSRIGVSYGGAGFSLSSSAFNLFGLQFQSVQTAYNTNGTLYTTLLNRGGTLADNGNILYPATAQPVLVTTNYYFGRPFIDPLPGDGAFSPTNTTSVLIASLGKPFWLAGYAKQAISNGASSKFGYLGQYFAGAFKVDTNGVVTTNQTGVLSEYGEFFPTEPGPTALVTMTNWGVNERGTGVVNVISLCVDANHDGTMDQTLWGPDTTSFLKPFRFWINNDCDWNSSGYDPVGQDVEISLVRLPDYVNFSISSWRDLEDYARLWICGVPALWASNGYQATLTWANVSNGNPAIKLFQAIEPDGGTRYLTDTNIAAFQTGLPLIYNTNSFCYTFANVTNGGTFTFPDNFFTNNANKYFIFEGASVGSGQLVLTITHNGQQVAQTGAWLDLRDVKDMYERVHITGVTNSVPPLGFLSSNYQQQNALRSTSDEDTNIIVFVHGWRMGMWDYLNFSESMFKRLYWQGYRGRFASVRWDTLSHDDFRLASTLQSFLTFNSSEYRAWQSAKGLSDYLTSLKQRFPNYNVNVCSHSMGGIVMAEALKLQLAAGQHNVNNYVLMQVAVPASCYDTTFTNYPPMLAAEASQPTPNTYRGYPGAISGAVSGHLVNFYNTNDYALATGTLPLIGAINWEANQENYKPDTGFGYTTDGTNCFNARQGYRIVTDSREIMSFCARPRSKAVGAQPNVGGVIQGGSVDLKANYGFDLDKSEHSAEFNRNIQRLMGFYHTLLNALIPPGQ